MSPHDLLQLKSSCSIYNIIRIKDTNTPPHCRFHPAETPRQSSAKPLEITAGVEMFRFKKKKKKNSHSADSSSTKSVFRNPNRTHEDKRHSQK